MDSISYLFHSKFVLITEDVIFAKREDKQNLITLIICVTYEKNIVDASDSGHADPGLWK